MAISVLPARLAVTLRKLVQARGRRNRLPRGKKEPTVMALEVKTESEVSPALAKAYQRAQGALEKQNYAYASEILRGILLVAPGFEEARLTLRQAQLERIAFKSNIFRQTLALCAASWAVFVKGPMALNKKEDRKSVV